MAIKSFDWMNDGARPSIKTVATKIGVSPSTVNRSIRELTSAGVLVVERRFRDSDRKDPLPNGYSFPPMPSHDVMGGGTDEPRSATREGPVTSEGRGPFICDGRVPPPVTAEEDQQEQDSTESDSGWDWSASGGHPSPGKKCQKDKPREDEGGSWQEQEMSADVSSAKYRNFNTPLPDALLELHAADIVDRLDDLRVQDGKNHVTEQVRQNWLKSARILLVAHRRPHAELLRLIRWVCEDDYWSHRIDSVYKLGQSYEAILKDSQSRTPRRAKVKPDAGKNQAAHIADGSGKSLEERRAEIDARFAMISGL